MLDEPDTANRLLVVEALCIIEPTLEGQNMAVTVLYVHNLALTVIYLALTVLYLALTVLYLALTALSRRDAGRARRGQPPYICLDCLIYALTVLYVP